MVEERRSHIISQVQLTPSSYSLSNRRRAFVCSSQPKPQPLCDYGTRTLRDAIRDFGREPMMETPHCPSFCWFVWFAVRGGGVATSRAWPKHVRRDTRMRIRPRRADTRKDDKEISVEKDSLKITKSCHTT